MFSPKSYSFDTFKERVQNAQQGLSEGWKNIAVKAKKEVKMVNKIARKALATEDGGKLRDGYVVTVNLDAGYDLSKEFQKNWMAIHKDSVSNATKAGEVDNQLNEFIKEWQKWDSYLEEFHGNLVVLPEVISKIEIIQKRIDAVGLQTQKIEDLLLEYEDASERYELEKCKVDMKVKLSSLVEAKHAEYTLKKTLASNREEANTSIVKEMSIKKIASMPHDASVESSEKQKAYEDAFLHQMNQYIQYGEIEKPISGSVTEQDTVSVEDINIEDSDLSTLREFLGPEEMNSLIKVQASQNKLNKMSFIPNENTESEENADANISDVSTTEQKVESGENNIAVTADVDTELKTEDVEKVVENISSDNQEIVNQSQASDDENEFFDAPSDNGV